MTGHVDVHHHLLTSELLDALNTHGIHAVGGEPVPPWNPQASLDIMNANGIERAVLSTPIPLHFLPSADAAAMARALNDYAADCARRWAGRFGYFATLPLPDIDAAIIEASRALDEAGAAGVLLLSNHVGIYQGDPVLDPLYAELDRRQAIAFVHPTVSTGTDYPAEASAGTPISAIQPSQLEFGFDTTRAVANLLISHTLDRFAGTRFIFTHSAACVPSVVHKLIDRTPLIAAYTTYIAEHGTPPPAEQLLDQLSAAEDAAREKVATLYFDTALSTAPATLDALTALVPISHILLGTDFPVGQEIGLRYTLRGIERYHGFSAEDRAAVLGENAEKLLRDSAQRRTPSSRRSCR